MDAVLAVRVRGITNCFGDVVALDGADLNVTGGSVTTAKGRSRARPVPVPARIGDPSTIKHVFLLVKEIRTYDQVLGDLPQGNGDASLTRLGENVTPNQHALARQFGLYDNFYDIGTNSAEGHNWLMQADNPEYTESSAGEYRRSYDTENDVVGHQKSGFIWTGAQAAPIPRRHRTRRRRPRRRSAVVPTAEQGVSAQWKTWKSHQRLTGRNAVPDYANPEQMNHYTWYETHNWSKPYPGEKKIYAPNDVPGACIRRRTPTTDAGRAPHEAAIPARPPEIPPLAGPPDGGPGAAAVPGARARAAPGGPPAPPR